MSQRNGNRVELVVSDDGRGFDVAALRAAALRAGKTEETDLDGMSERELLGLAFQSGISTNPMITELAGRGLGLAIVQERAERLAGMLSVETHPGTGSRIQIVLPLTMATFRGVLVRAEGQTFVMPTHAIERIVRVEAHMFQSVENVEVLVLDQVRLALVRLRDVLELPARRVPQAEQAAPYAVIAGSVSRRTAFLVDEVVGEQEVLVKSLGKQLSRVRNVGGAAILGSGAVMPILNMADLVKHGVGHAGASAQPAAESREAPAQRTVLVAEDSITARTLLKNILESAGFAVRTAVDGAEALALLRTEEVDLVVSDVDMPRMSGFDLTARIRADKRLALLPVILVTALASREDRERGIEAGANAYIVKNSFEQSNLLEIIDRFI